MNVGRERGSGGRVRKCRGVGEWREGEEMLGGELGVIKGEKGWVRKHYCCFAQVCDEHNQCYANYNCGHFLVSQSLNVVNSLSLRSVTSGIQNVQIA